MVEGHVHSDFVFWPCLLRAEISPDFLNVLMILWTVNGEILKFFAILHWETLFLNCWTICSHSCSQMGEPHPILACGWLSLSGCSFYTQSWHCHLFLVNLWNILGVFWESLNFHSLLLPCPNMLQASNSVWVVYISKNKNRNEQANKPCPNQFKH